MEAQYGVRAVLIWRQYLLHPKPRQSIEDDLHTFRVFGHPNPIFAAQFLCPGVAQMVF